MPFAKAADWLRDLEAAYAHVDFDSQPDHCSRWVEAQLGRTLNNFCRHAIEVICIGTRTAVYNLPINWRKVDWSYGYPLGIRAVYSDSLATFDFCRLTGLVIAAHDARMRLEIKGVAPRRLALHLWPRPSRTGSMHERLPTIEDMIDEQRRRGPVTPAPYVERTMPVAPPDGGAA